MSAPEELAALLAESRWVRLASFGFVGDAGRVGDSRPVALVGGAMVETRVPVEVIAYVSASASLWFQFFAHWTDQIYIDCIG